MKRKVLAIILTITMILSNTTAMAAVPDGNVDVGGSNIGGSNTETVDPNGQTQGTAPETGTTPDQGVTPGGSTSPETGTAPDSGASQEVTPDQGTGQGGTPDQNQGQVPEEQAGKFQITGGTLGSDYTYEGNVLTISTNTPLTVSGTTSTDRIVIGENVEANLTIENLKIDLQEESPIRLLPSTTKLNLTIKGENILLPGRSSRDEGYAGINVPKDATLNIKGNGKLDVTGGRFELGGAAIGADQGPIPSSGGFEPSGSTEDRHICGNINISGGQISAVANSLSCAAIGDGFEHVSSNGKQVNISGGYVKASVPNNSNVGAFGKTTVSVTGGIVEVNDELNKATVKNNCIIKENNKINVYGTASLPMDYTIPRDTMLTIPENAVINTGNFKLTNDGKIYNHGSLSSNVDNNIAGAIYNKGTITGTLVNNGHILDLGTLPVPSVGAGTIYATKDSSYKDSNNTEQYVPAISMFSIASCGFDTLQAGFYVVDKDTVIDKRLIVKGEVNLILAQETKLTVNGGIQVSEGNTLKVFGQMQGAGKLNIAETSGNAGIGGNISSVREIRNSGTVEIYDGIIDISAVGAGIGGANGSGWRDAAGNNGNLVIKGGHVTAVSESAAGIGGGYRNASIATDGHAGSITISGGVVKAESKNNGSAIGIGGSTTGGEYGAVNINGNTVVYAKAKPQDGVPVILGADNNNWNGIVFETLVDREGKNPPKISNMVYGTVDLNENIEIPAGESLEILDSSNLEICENVTLTIPQGSTLLISGGYYNRGKVCGNGEIISDYAMGGNYPELPRESINVRAVGSMELKFGKNSEVANKVIEGESIDINAIVREYSIGIESLMAVNKLNSIKAIKTKNSLSAINTGNTAKRMDISNKVKFYQGAVAPENLLGEAQVNNEIAKLTLSITGEKWKAKDVPYDIWAVFTGSKNIRSIKEKI